MEALEVMMILGFIIAVLKMRGCFTKLIVGLIIVGIIILVITLKSIGVITW